MLRYLKSWHFMLHSLYLWKALDKALDGYRCINLIWDSLSYGVEPIDYWTIFSVKLNKIKTENFSGIWERFFGVVEKPQWVGFNGVYFTIFKANVWKILIFEWILLLKIQTNCNKLDLEGKISWPLNVFTLPNLEIFNSENVKNKECVHTWANVTSYSSNL
jgi:hypothetical protein